MGLLNKNRAQCREVCSQLEDAATLASGAKNLPELLAVLPAPLKLHADSCARCRESAETFLAARAALSALPSSANLAGPWFGPRVMAAIAARKAELASAVDTWTFLPKLAARLTWASSIALLLASAWLYQKPVHTAPATATTVATDITGEPLVDSTTSATSDDVLINLAQDHTPR